MRWRLNPIVHTFYDALRFVGLRDRLRCPSCSAVGTWKPHGGVFDRADTKRKRRWLCKYCGFYIGPEGVQVAFPDPFKNSWQLRADTMVRDTPIDAVHRALTGVWPWRG